MIRDFLILSLKDVKSNGLRSLLVILSVAVGAASLIAFVSQAEGMKYSIENQFKGLAANVIIAVSHENYLSLPQIELIRSFPHVYDLKYALIETARVKVGSRVIVLNVVGLKNDTFNLVFPSAKAYLGSINLDLFGQAVVGYNLGTKFSIVPGMNLEISTPRGTRMRAVVTAVLSKVGITPLAVGFNADNSLYVNLFSLQEATRKFDRYNLIYIIVDNPSNVEKVQQSIKGFIESHKFSLFAPLTIMKAYMSAANFAERFLIAMSLMAFIASGFGIANTLMITVIERTREIGVMKAIGFNSFQILIYYITLSIAYGIMGGILGVAIGFFLANLVSRYVNVIGLGVQQYLLKYFRMNLPSAVVTPQLLIEALAFSILISVIAGFYPAYKAARLDPVQALKSE